MGCEGSLSCPSWFVILFLCRLSFTFSGVGVAWSQVCGPSCDSWVLDSSDARLCHPDALASGRTLSCCRLGFAWRLWCWVVLAPAVFLGLTLGSSLSLPVLAAGLRWLRFILGGPPSVASLWRLLPWFFVRYLLACPCGAAVPLDSWVLWCSSSSCSVTYLRSGLCSSSVHDRDVAFPPLVGFAFGSSCGSTTSGCRCELRLALVRTAVRPSHESVLILQPGFLFSGLVERGAFHSGPSPLVFLRDVVTLWGH